MISPEDNPITSEGYNEYNKIIENISLKFTNRPKICISVYIYVSTKIMEIDMYQITVYLRITNSFLYNF